MFDNWGNRCTYSKNISYYVKIKLYHYLFWKPQFEFSLFSINNYISWINSARVRQGSDKFFFVSLPLSYLNMGRYQIEMLIEGYLCWVTIFGLNLICVCESSSKLSKLNLICVARSKVINVYTAKHICWANDAKLLCAKNKKCI